MRNLSNLLILGYFCGLLIGVSFGTELGAPSQKIGDLTTIRKDKSRSGRREGDWRQKQSLSLFLLDKVDREKTEKSGGGDHLTDEPNLYFVFAITLVFFLTVPVVVIINLCCLAADDTKNHLAKNLEE